MSGSPWTGARATMNLVNMASGGANSSNPAHISSTLSAYLGGPLNEIETGILDGWVDKNGGRQCDGIFPYECVYTSYESGSGGSSTCINNGCGAYVLYWADITTAGKTPNIYLHIVKFTSPSPRTSLYSDIGYTGAGRWTVHMMSSNLGLDFYGTSTIESAFTTVQQVRVGGQLRQVPNAGACADTNSMTFALYRGDNRTYAPWDAEVSNGTAHVSPGFNGTHLVPGTNPGTWLWNLPTSGNPNGC